MPRGASPGVICDRTRKSFAHSPLRIAKRTSRHRTTASGWSNFDYCDVNSARRKRARKATPSHAREFRQHLTTAWQQQLTPHLSFGPAYIEQITFPLSMNPLRGELSHLDPDSQTHCVGASVS